MKLVYFPIISFSIYLSQSDASPLLNINSTDLDVTHEESKERTKSICENRDVTCKSNYQKVCAVRKINDTFQYQTFENSCYLFVINLCDNPGKEFFIVSENCNYYIKNPTRRHIEKSDLENSLTLDKSSSLHRTTAYPDESGSSDGTTETPDESGDGSTGTPDGSDSLDGTTEAPDESGDGTTGTPDESGSPDGTTESPDEFSSSDGTTETPDESGSSDGSTETPDEFDPSDVTTKTLDESLNGSNTTKPGLRQFSFSQKYKVKRTFDGRICPYSCPNIYDPMCLAVNRFRGLRFKYFQFANHCEGYIYYCKHKEEFAPTPGFDDTAIYPSLLAWSYCAKTRFIDFSMGSKAAAHISRLGWLEGNERLSKLLEPHQRKPGFG